MGHQPQLVNPLMMGSLPNFYNSVCTINRAMVGTDSFNQVETAYVADPILKNIRCYKEPASGAEVRKPQETTTMTTYIVALDGYYGDEVSSNIQEIQSGLIRSVDQAEINGKPYNITRVASDDTRTTTWLTLEVINAPNE